MLCVLLTVLPTVVIVLATALAPGSRVRLTLDEGGRQITKVVDLGIAPDPTSHPAPPAWARFLPGYGGSAS